MFIYTWPGRVMLANFWRGGGGEGGNQLLVGLFTNDATLDVDMSSLDLTEATFGGYEQKMTTYIESSDVERIGDDAFVLLGNAPFEWTCTSDPQTIRGWFLIDNSSGEMIAVEKYDEPHELVVGSTHRLYLKLGDGQCA